MRVLYINPFSQEVSGPDESLRTLLRCLIPLGVQAHVAIPVHGPQVERYEALGARVHVVPLTILRRKASLGELGRLLRSAMGSVPGMVRLCRQIRPDIVHTNMEVVVDGLLAAAYLTIPHVLHYRGNTLDEPPLVFDVLVRFWTAGSRQIICISRATARLFESRGRAAMTEVMYNPIDLRSFADAERSEALRAQWGASPDSFLVGTVARLHPRKDLETFLRAAGVVAQIIPDVTFVIVGSAAGADEEAYEIRLRALANDLGLGGRVAWAGARRDIPTVMKALDLFVLTSRHEGFGRVVAEAMAAGIPVVVSDEGALPELVGRNQYGIAANAGDPASFANEILTLIRDPRLRERLALASRERSQSFDSNQVAFRMLEIYCRFVKRVAA